jgi:G3E family GTPase
MWTNVLLRWTSAGMKGGIVDEKCRMQGVHAVFDGTPGKPWREGERHRSRMVFIGRDLDEGLLRSGFTKCLA